MSPAEPSPPPAPLHVVTSGTGPRVVLVHGFTQTHVSWAPVAGDLAADHEVVGVDAPGHGGSTGVDADLVAGAHLLGAATGPATYVGYSMGGRLALRLALDRPELVDGLVLLGATAGIDEGAERAERRAADGALADRIDADGVAAFLDGWLAQPLFAGLAIDPADRAARLANPSAGLASSLRLAGTGTMDPPWWEELASLRLPVLVVAGADDAKFTALAHRLVTAIGPSATFAAVDGAGHAAHLQDPDRFASLVRAFVADRVRPSR